MFHFQWKETQRVLKPWKTIRIKLQTLLGAIYSSPGYCRYTHSMKCQCTHEQRLCTKKRKALVWSNCFTVTPYSTGWTGRTMGCYKFYTWDQAHMHTEIYMTYADIQRERERVVKINRWGAKSVSLNNYANTWHPRVFLPCHACCNCINIQILL